MRREEQSRAEKGAMGVERSGVEWSGAERRGVKPMVDSSRLAG